MAKRKSLKDNLKEEMNLVHLAYAPTEDDADEMTEALEKEGIQVQTGGGVRDLYALGGKMGIELLVRPEDLERGVEIVKELSGTSPAAGESPDSKKKALTWIIVAAIGIAAMLLARIFVLRM